MKNIDDTKKGALLQKSHTNLSVDTQIKNNRFIIWKVGLIMMIVKAGFESVFTILPLNREEGKFTQELQSHQHYVYLSTFVAGTLRLRSQLVHFGANNTERPHSSSHHPSPVHGTLFGRLPLQHRLQHHELVRTQTHLLHAVHYRGLLDARRVGHLRVCLHANPG